MALDVGTLVAYIDIDDRKARRGLDAFQRTVRQVAAAPVRDVEMGIDTREALRALARLTDQVTGVPDGSTDVTVDTDAALRGLDDLVAQLRGLPDGDATTDVDVSAAMRALGALAGELRGLPSTSSMADVDISSAMRAIARLVSEARGVPDVDIDVTVDVDDGALDDVAGDAKDALGDAGEGAGEAFGARVVDALESIPIAGAVVGVGAAMAAALIAGVRDGLSQEADADRLLATTDLTPQQVAKIGRAAGEAYAENFGESVAGNMDTAKAALGAGLLDPDATARDTQRIIEQLSGVADLLGEEIPAVARAAGQLIKTGFADNAAEAFDLVVRGAKSGLNASEDLLDTINEYSVQFAKLGLDGPTALGLLSQAVKAGARDTDIAADAFKEFSIRATDGSETSAAGFEALGLSAETMTARFAAGGAGAASGLDMVLDRLRAMEDPVARNAAAVALFGTQAEDLGDALFAFDPSSAVAALGEVEGAAANAVAALGDNEQSAITSAMRNIELAADGIKGAMAEAFGPQLTDFATTVRENRTLVVETLLAIVNGTFDVARAFVEVSASGVESFGEMAAGTEPVLDGLASIVDASADVAYAMGRRGLSTELREAADGIRSAGDELAKVPDRTDAIAQSIRTNVIERGLDPAQARLNEFGDMQVAEARVHDATVRLAGDIAAVGYASDGTALQINALSADLDLTTAAGRTLSDQLAAARDGLREQAMASQEAGRSTAELSADFMANREALVAQVMAMGYSRDAAQQLIEKYGGIPRNVETLIGQPGMGQAHVSADALERKTRAIPTSWNTTVTADTSQAERALDAYSARLQGQADYYARLMAQPAPKPAPKAGGKAPPKYADGGIVTAAADGTPARESMIAKGGANILWAEPETQWEAYISGKPSMRTRNIAILTDVAERFGKAVVDPAAPAPRAAANGALVGTAASKQTSRGVRAEIRDYAEALRRFHERATSGSETARQAFSALGIDGQQAGAAIATGGRAAVAALDEVLARLQAVDDRMTTLTANTALFGSAANTAMTALATQGAATPPVSTGTGQVSRAMAEKLPRAMFEDGSGQRGWQFWDAAAMGNGQGQSYIIRNDETGEQQIAVAAANGLLRQSMIAKGGANITWAEPETGWEAYISGKPSMRARNEALLADVAARFGMTMVPTSTSAYADGGMAGVAAPTATAGRAGSPLTVEQHFHNPRAERAGDDSVTGLRSAAAFLGFR